MLSGNPLPGLFRRNDSPKRASTRKNSEKVYEPSNPTLYVVATVSLLYVVSDALPKTPIEERGPERYDTDRSPVYV